MSKARQLADLGNQVDDGAITGTNLIINGAMQVAQRGTSITGITNGAAKYTLDRFFAECVTSAGSVISATQSSDAPAGFNSSASIAVTTSGATSSSDYVYYRQNVEGFNTSHFNFGSSDAQTITLSFWVKSSLTGTFGGWFGAASNARFNIFSYTINSANTWEYKTVTVAGDTSGAWNTTNGVGLQVAWSLSCGSTYTGTPDSWTSSLLLGATGQTNVTETASATWQITGVQLEVGDTATPFEHRSYGDELARCQRYFERWDFPVSFDWYVTNSAASAHDVDCPYNGAFAVAKRAAPTYSRSGTFLVSNLVSNDWTARPTTNSITFYNGSSAAGRYYSYNQTSAHLDFDAEL